MTNNEEIIFDASCGISEDEQREIFAQINGIAEKNRLSLSIAADGGAGKGKKKRLFKAKKSGGLFPVLVNAAAIAVLAGGFLALYVFQGKTDAQVREGARVYNSAERALIEEIRRESSSDIAWGELDRLSREQAQAATVEAQMGALFANLSHAVNENNFEEAATIIRSVRDFLNTPAFQGLRSIQARKGLYTQMINSFEIMVDALRRNQAALASGIMSLDRSAEAMFVQLQERNAQLERDIADRDRLLQTSNSANASAAQNIVALERRVETLQTQNGTLQTDFDRERGRANSLQADITRQTATIVNRNDCIDQIQDVIRGRTIADMTIGELSESLSRIQRALQSLN